MPRSKNPDRSAVTSQGGPVLGVRLSPVEAEALAALVELQRQAVAEHGLEAAVTSASVVRFLIRREAQARGVWKGGSASAPRLPGKRKGR